MSATAEEFDISFHFPSLRKLSDSIANLVGRVETMAVDQAALDSDIQALSASVDALIAIVQNPPAPAAVDLQPQADEVAAIKASVDAAVAAAAPAA